MARKKPKPDRCVHCLGIFEKLTWDHVFPEAWYPKTTIPNQYKWQIPSCQDCNRKYGALENDLLIRLSICLDPSDPACAGIFEKGMRAIDPQYAKDEKDKKRRQAKKDKILRQCWIGESIPQDHLITNFGINMNLSVQEQLAISISESSIKRLLEKIVRGIFYIEDNQFIEPPYTIHSLVVRDEDVHPFIAAIRKISTVYAREPGITIYRALLPDDQISSIFSIEIWQRLKAYAFVINSDVASSTIRLCN